MKDESHNVMRGQTVEHCRNRIREYARAQMLNH
jgi:FtsZ-interacting cell division protein ZipA